MGILGAKSAAMIKNAFVKNQLSKTFCHKCGASLEGAELVTISEAPIALVGHLICPNCQAESMITITVAGSGTTPVISDLKGKEIKKFISSGTVTYNELLDLHQMLEKESLWKLLQKQEKSLVKKQNTSEKKKKSLP